MSRRPVPRALRHATRPDHDEHAPTTDALADDAAGAAGDEVAGDEAPRRPSPRPRPDGPEPDGDTTERATERPKPSPRPRRAADPDADGADFDDAHSDLADDAVPRESGVRVAALAVAVALAVALAGVLFWFDHQGSSADAARRDAVPASVRAAETILSYDHTKMDADIAAASKLTTGQFRKDYADTSKTVAPIAKEYKAVVKATVKASSVVSATSDQVVVLLFVDQSTQSTRVQGTQVDQARVRMTMHRVGDDWLAAKVEAL